LLHRMIVADDVKSPFLKIRLEFTQLEFT
jgi:hypothetical protein